MRIDRIQPSALPRFGEMILDNGTEANQQKIDAAFEADGGTAFGPQRVQHDGQKYVATNMHSMALWTFGQFRSMAILGPLRMHGVMLDAIKKWDDHLLRGIGIGNTLRGVEDTLFRMLDRVLPDWNQRHQELIAFMVAHPHDGQHPGLFEKVNELANRKEGYRPNPGQPSEPSDSSDSAV